MSKRRRHLPSFLYLPVPLTISEAFTICWKTRGLRVEFTTRDPLINIFAMTVLIKKKVIFRAQIVPANNGPGVIRRSLYVSVLDSFWPLDVFLSLSVRTQSIFTILSICFRQQRSYISIHSMSYGWN